MPDKTPIEQDLERLAVQEQRLQFAVFNAETAWTLGQLLKAEAEKRGVAVAIDIQLHGHPLFFYAMPGTTPDNVDWLRRKRNVTARFHRSSYAISRTMERDGTTLQAKYGADLKDYAAAGGCFPLLLPGHVCIGSVAVSGLPQREDHNLVVAVLADYLSIPRAEVALA